MADEQQPQSFMEDAVPEEAISMRFARFIMRFRFATLMTLLSIGFFFSIPLINGIVLLSTGETIPGVDTVFSLQPNVRDTMPEHPFIHAQDKFSGRFGTASYVSLAVVKKDGEIYDYDFLEKVSRITNLSHGYRGPAVSEARSTWMDIYANLPSLLPG